MSKILSNFLSKKITTDYICSVTKCILEDFELFV